MTMAWGLDPRTNDVVIGRDGRLLNITGAQQVAQKIRVALKHYFNEYFLDVSAGVPYYEVVLGSKDKALAASVMRQQVLLVPGVRAVAKQQTTFQNSGRGLEYFVRAEVDGDSGPEIIEITDTI